MSGRTGIVDFSPTDPAMPDTRQLTFLARVRRALTNARADADVQTLLGEMGYDRDEIDAGLVLVATAEREAREADTERAESRAATRTAAQARAKVRQAHVRTAKLARTVHERGSAEWTTLGLSGERSRAAAAALAETRRFYEALLADAALLDPLAARKVTQAVVARALADVDAAEAAGARQVAESGEAQVATAERDAAAEAVGGYWEDFSDVAEVALEDRPQWREILGMTEAGS